MTCTECNETIPFHEEHIKVRVAYSDERGVEEHCPHNPFDEQDPAIVAILGSRDCAEKWLSKQGDAYVH